jgi:hypothetical protein
VKACIGGGCHSTPDARIPPVLCAGTEAETWEKQDKHKQAFLKLKSPKAEEMAKILSFKNGAMNEKNCIACHGIVADEKLTDRRSFDLNDGVSCVVCHGAHMNWVDDHSARLKGESWRLDKSRAEKQADGMTDLWSPVKRADLCMSCHIGNVAQGKFVTHEMYAAGHPPLPGFEIALFSDEMPRHWQYLFEKLEDRKDPKIQTLLKKYYHMPRFERTQLLLIGAAVSLRHSLEVLVAQTSNDKEQSSSGADFSVFECYACHHDLKVPGWRQARGYQGTPGRPLMRDWPLALIDVGIAYLSKDEPGLSDFGRLRANLIAAFDEPVFGNSEKIKQAAGRLEAWLNKFISDLSEANYDNPKALQDLLRYICRDAGSRLLDYDSARQLAWAFTLIAKDSPPKQANEAEYKKQLAALDALLKLKLPSGQNGDITKELPQALKAIGSYDARKFSETMRKLGESLGSTAVAAGQ